MIRFLQRNENIGRLPGYYIPGDVTYSDPGVTDSRFFWFVYFPKNNLWFIHPFKLHGNEIEHKFNLVTLKFVLLEKVKSSTDRKPTIALRGIKLITNSDQISILVTIRTFKYNKEV